MAENNSSSPLLPCPFCGGAAAVQKESPADNSGGYFVECKSGRASTNLRYACGDNPVPLLMERWNARAPQAVKAQAATAALDTNLLRAEILEHASKGSRLVRTLFNEPNGTLSDVEVGDWIQRAQQYLTLPLQAAPAAVADWEEAARAMSVEIARNCNSVPQLVFPFLYLGLKKLLATPALPATEDSSAGDLADWLTPVSELLGHISDALPDDEFAKIDTAKWNAVSSLVGSNRTTPAQAAVQAEPVAWANWKVGTTSYAPYRTRSQAQASANQSAIVATQEGPYEVVPLYTAPQAQPADAPTAYLQEADQHLLHRFIETTEDDESFDIGKDAVKRLANLGVVESCGFGRYGVTMFGYWVHEHYWHQNPSLPLKTNADRDREHRAAMAAAQEGGNAAKEA